MVEYHALTALTQRLALEYAGAVAAAHVLYTVLQSRRELARLSAVDPDVDEVEALTRRRLTHEIATATTGEPGARG